MQIYRKGNKLYLEGTFPPKPGSTKTIPHQQYLTLGVSANPPGLKVATYGLRDHEVFRLDTSRMKDPPYVVKELVVSP